VALKLYCNKYYFTILTYATHVICTNVTNQRTIMLSVHITKLLSIKETNCIFIYNCY